MSSSPSANSPAPDPGLEFRVDVLAAVAGEWLDPDHPPRAEAVEESLEVNGSFTEEAMAFAINQQMSLLIPADLLEWGSRLMEAIDPSPEIAPISTMAVLNPGNIPMVELQDFVAIWLSGCTWAGVISSRSPALMPAFLDSLRTEWSREGGEIEEFPARIVDLDVALSGADALIASGSDEVMDTVAARAEGAGIPQSRQWIRGHRFSIAVLDGKESEEELESLAEDALLHEGLGCRNVAVVFAPEGMNIDPVLDAFAAFRGTFPAPESTRGRLRMQRAFLKAIDVPHAFAEDDQFLISRGDPGPQAPGHVRWCEMDGVRKWVDAEASRIQCVVCTERLARTWPQSERLGEAQRPELDWAPDDRSHEEYFEQLGKG